MSIYTVCFYCYSIRRSAVRKQIVCALMFYFILWVYLSYANINLEFTKHFCGIVCSGMTIVFFGSPLVNLVHVIRTKSTSTLPFLMILANFFVTGQWWFYGIIIEDNFLKIPYCLGWCLATVQLLLFVIFPSSPSDTKSYVDSNLSRSHTIQKKHFEDGDRFLDYKLGWDILL